MDWYDDSPPHPISWAPKYLGQTAFTSAEWAFFGGQGLAKNAVNAIRGIKDYRLSDPDGEKKKLFPLFRTTTGLYIRLLYGMVEDTFNRPIASEPADWIDCIIREYDSSFKGYLAPIVLSNPIRTKRCLNLSSYNYLGFGGLNRYPGSRKILADAVTKLPLTTASPSVELGFHPVHRQLEVQISKFLNKEDCMLVGMGFATNSTVLPALVGKGDLIISDQLNHTSIVQGARESGAKIMTFMHNDAGDLELTFQKAVTSGKRYGKILLIVEGIYSMEGDLCNLKEIIPVAKKYGAYIYLDEAHSIGAIGPTGRGITEELGISTDEIDVMMGTFSKSFGSSGGYIAGKKDLVNRARVYAAGCTDAAPLPPACTVQIIEALKVISGEDGTDIGARKLRAIRENSIFFRRRLVEMGLEVLGMEPSPVIPVMLYNPSKIGDFSRFAFREGLAIVSVGAPAVPLYYGRARFCISAAHSREDLEDALVKIDRISDKLCLKYRTIHKPNPRFPGTLDSLEHKFQSEKKDRALKAAQGRDKALAALAKIQWKPLVEQNDSQGEASGWADTKRTDSTMKVNVSNWDYLGFANDPGIQAACIKTLDHKGLGSCGPRGFYGTYPEHLKAEKDVAEFLGTEQAILYPFGACTVSSVIACMAQRGDVLIVDNGVGRNVLTGLSLSRAEVRFYKHCDAADCEKVLKRLAGEDWKNIHQSTFGRRKFIISESVFGSTGEIAPIPELCALREKYRCRFILDESHSFGIMGASGRGITEHFNLKATEVDVICASLEGMASCCGFSAGANGIVSYQRLLGSGYCFSAAPPPYLATAISACIAALKKSGNARLKKLSANASALRIGLQNIPGVKIAGSKASKMISVSLRYVKKRCLAKKLLKDICTKCQAAGLAVSTFNNRPTIGFRPEGVEFEPALRICASARLGEEDVSFALKILGAEIPKALAKHKIEEIEETCVEDEKSSLSMKPTEYVDLINDPGVKVYKAPSMVRDDGVSLPVLILVGGLLSAYRNFLKHESVVTARFVDSWLRMLRLDRNSTSPAVRTFYCLAHNLGSHMTYSLLLPSIFWCFGATPLAALPFIFYSLLNTAGCMLKCVMAENDNSWPSITAMNALGLPFFLIRYYFGQSWLYNKFTILNVGIAAACVAWVVVVCLSRMQIGGSPSDVVGGLVAGAVSLHLMIQFFCEPTLLWFSQGISHMCPPLWFALCAVCLCPLPTGRRSYAIGMYKVGVNHMAMMVAFMYGLQFWNNQAVLAVGSSHFWTIMFGLLGIIFLLAYQLCAKMAIRKFLTVTLQSSCSMMPTLRRNAVAIFEFSEPVLSSVSYGLLAAVAVPATLQLLS